MRFMSLVLSLLTATVSFAGGLEKGFFRIWTESGEKYRIPVTAERMPGTRLVALCNGDSSSHEDFRGTLMKTFHGLLLAVVEGSATGLDVHGRERWHVSGVRPNGFGENIDCHDNNGAKPVRAKSQ